MSTESSNRLGGWESPGDALAEIVSYPGDLQTFFSGLFDQLGRLTDELLVRELSHQRSERQIESEALREQIDRLAAVAAELADTVAERKKQHVVECNNV